MKVLVVSSKYPPEYSGSGLRAHNTYLRLREKFGIEFEVITSSTSDYESTRYEFENVSVERIMSRNLRRINRLMVRTPFSRVTNALVFNSEVRKVTRKLNSKTFDLVHTFGFSPATSAAIHHSIRNQTPLIIELVNTGATPLQSIPGRNRLVADQLKNRSAIVAISAALGDHSKNLGLVNNTWTRPNPVDPSAFSAISHSERQTAMSTLVPGWEDKKIVLYIAKFLDRKNHSFLIDVLKHLPDDFRLLLGGPPLMDNDLVPGLKRNELESLEIKARSLGVSHRMKLKPGFLDMPEYLKIADVFCFPARDEGMGTPLLEAIASGVPVVANEEEPSFQEWIRPGDNGFLAPFDPEVWAEKIQTASGISLDQRKLMSVRILEVASVDAIDAQYFKMLEALSSSAPDEEFDVNDVLGS